MAMRVRPCAPAHAAWCASVLACAGVLAPPIAARAQPPAVATAGAGDPVDPAALARLRAEVAAHERVTETVEWLADVYSPRLTGSDQLGRAGDWAVRTLGAWGLTNARREPWGAFPHGWEPGRFALAVTAPVPYPMIAYPQPWTPGVPGGRVTGTPVLVRFESDSDLARYHGRLRGRIVMNDDPGPWDAPPHLTPDATRLADTALARLAAAPADPAPPPRTAAQLRAMLPAAQRAMLERRARVRRFLAAEGVAALLTYGGGDDGTVFVDAGGDLEAWTDTAPARRTPPVAVVAAEHFGRLVRTLQKGVPLTVELVSESRFVDGTPNAFNVVAELPGQDPALRDEVVLLGAHLDAWAAGTGATDNATGVAVMMEALRALKAAGVPLRRTVRLALWTGEEQVVLGSTAYVRAHVGEPDAGAAAGGPPPRGVGPRATGPHVVAYFNLDKGTGRVRGIAAAGPTPPQAVAGACLAPFAADSGGGAALYTRSIAGLLSDHLPFAAAGVPAFAFVQDPLDYDTRTHHTNMDAVERVQPDALRWNAVVVATCAMQAANRVAPAAAPRR